jgi:hypothetical protein
VCRSGVLTGLIIGALWIDPAPDCAGIFEFIPWFGKMGCRSSGLGSGAHHWKIPTDDLVQSDPTRDLPGQLRVAFNDQGCSIHVSPWDVAEIDFDEIGDVAHHSPVRKTDLSVPPLRRIRTWRDGGALNDPGSRHRSSWRRRISIAHIDAAYRCRVSMPRIDAAYREA